MSKVSEQEAVQEINARFYRALEAYDLDGITEIWLHEPWVACVHPGWQLVYGWPSVEESWKSIFANDSRLRVRIRDVRISIEGNCAWVLCIEEIFATFREDLMRSHAQATNIYVKTAGRWKMTLHHASPVEQPEIQVSSDALH